MVSKKQPYKVSFETVNLQSNGSLFFGQFIANYAVSFDDVNSFIIWNNTTNALLQVLPGDFILSPGQKFEVSGKDKEQYIGKINLTSFHDPTTTGQIIVIKKMYINEQPTKIQSRFFNLQTKR